MTEVKPKHYKIHLEPDLKNFKVDGTVEIVIEAGTPVSDITLNAHQLAIWSGEVEQEGKFVQVPIRVDPTHQELLLDLPIEMNGQITIKLVFVAQINETLVGLYRSKYVVGDQEKYIAVSQFEESHARQVFPCFDHPGKKATFDIEYVLDKNLTGIANTPVLEEIELEDGRKLMKFETTPIMASYLLFFGMGEFEFLEDSSKPVLQRVVTTPGKTQYGQFGLEYSIKALQFGEDYTGVKYPLTKMDQIAVPDFAAGAMENYGAITYRENLLLVYPGITSSAGLERVAEVIGHEWAHQWFGNLVTPKDWKYIWLNESIATLFGYAIIDHYHPEWRIWEQFLVGETNGAFERDSLIETFPIELPGEGKQLEINAATAPIIYNKGAAILQMIRGYLGEESFRKGINHFLTKFQFGNASSEDFWQAFDEITDVSVSKMMETWVHQPGYPIIEVSKIGNKVTLTQKRFSYLSHESQQTWIIPITIVSYAHDGSSHSTKVLLQDPIGSVSLPEDVIAFKLNIQQSGFYRIMYTEENLHELGKLVATQILGPQDRFGVQNDLYALVRSGDYSIGEYLDFLDYYKDEDAYLPLMDIASNLLHAYNVVITKRDQIKTIGRRISSHILAKLGYEPQEEEAHTTAILRSTMLWVSFRFDDESVAAFGAKKFQQLQEGKTVHPDILVPVLRIGAAMDSTSYNWIKAKLEAPETGEQEKINMLRAFGSFNDCDSILNALKYSLEKVPPGNRYIPIIFAAGNPIMIDHIWQWYLDHLNALEQLHGSHYEQVIAGVVGLGGLDREEEVKEFFNTYMHEKALAKDAIKMTLERLEINSRLRNR